MRMMSPFRFLSVMFTCFRIIDLNFNISGILEVPVHSGDFFIFERVNPG